MFQKSRNGKPNPKYKNQPSSPSKNFKKKKIVASNRTQISGLEDNMRLNRYLAHSGVCSRRNADKYISMGAVTINGKTVTELGTRVNLSDKVAFEGETLALENFKYFLLNKPKGFITTLDDPKERKKVIDLFPKVTERIYPIGRLDRNTTGLLLMTNDGSLAKKLMHPSSNIAKIYHAILDKPLTKADLMKISNGLILEDGPIQVDNINYVEGKRKNEVGLELHSGRNRVVRRIFEHLGYKVEKLDRTVLAGLTKKNLPRSQYRELTKIEVERLKKL